MERIHLFMTNDDGKTFNKIDGNKFKESTIVELYKRVNRNSWEGYDWCKRTIKGKPYGIE